MPGDLFAVLDGDANETASPFVTVEMACLPRGKGRPRGTIIKPRNGPAFISFYTDAETRQYETALSWRAKAAMRGKPIATGPLAVRVFAMMPVPKSWPAKDRDAVLAGTKFPTGLPDVDNIFKSIADSFNKIVYEDDKQIVRVLIVKEFAENPGLIVEVYTLP